MKRKRGRSALEDCQSCGMPLQRDDRGGGTNADGSTSRTYCSHCYQGGHFVMPNMTVRQMQTRVKAKLMSVGAAPPLAARLVRSIPTLRRWRNDK